MQFVGSKIWIICAQVLLGLLWLCLLVQITTIVSYRHCFTAGELLAWIVANSYESGDIIQEDVLIAKPERSEIIAVLTTGAYNYSMASNYNRLTRPPIVILTKDDEYVAVERESLADLLINDK